MAIKKCLVVTLSSARETGDVNRLAHCFASLDANGIEWDRATVDTLAASATISANYDFIVFPEHKAGYDAIVDDAAITIPMISLYAQAGATGFGASSGVTGSRIGIGDKWLDVPFTNEAFIAAYTGYYALDTTNGKALATVSATEPNEGVFTGAAQTNAGTVAAWRNPTAGGSYLYASAHDSLIHAYLPFLLQEAINDGVLDSSVIRKAPLTVDLDHLNGDFSEADPTIIDKIASYIPDGGMMWAGMNNGGTLLSAMTTAVRDKLRQYSGTKFKYCYHNHGTNITSGNFPNCVEAVNKVAQDADYQLSLGYMTALGLEFHQPGYYNSGANMWSESTLELFSRNVSVRSSPDNLTSQAGYGFKVFRCIRTSTRCGPSKENLHYNQHKHQHTAHNILILTTWDLANGNLNGGSALDMPYATIAKWRNNFRWIGQAISMGMTLYMHDEDFIAADQSPGIKQHGYVQMQILADISTYLKDVVHGFADPVNYFD